MPSAVDGAGSGPYQIDRWARERAHQTGDAGVLIAFRADSSATIGFGHIRRCLALAEALAGRGARCAFICRKAQGDLNAAVADAGHLLLELPAAADPAPAGRAGEAMTGEDVEIADAAAMLTLCRELGQVDAVVIDHYELGAAWERVVKASIPRCIVIDDLATRPHLCDALIDTGPGEGRTLAYDRLIPAQALTLIGPRYALLRREFVSKRAQYRPRAWPIRRVLVNFGGTDALPYYESALIAVRDVLGPEPDIDIVTAGTIAKDSALGQRIAADPRIRHHVATAAMAELMSAADLAIGAGGNSAWERACLGLPAVMIAIAENQAEIVAEFGQRGAAIAIQDPAAHPAALRDALSGLLADPARLQEMSARASQLVDGSGAGRLAAILVCPGISLRRAAAADRARIWQWRNEPFVRDMSNSPEPISWEAHCGWFAGVLASSSRDLLIGEAAGRPIGVLRFDIAGREATISVYLTPEGRGNGMGPELLRGGERWLREQRPDVEGIVAEILSANAPSIAAFSAARYRRRQDGTYYREILKHAAA